MIGYKRILSSKGEVEIVVKELAARLVNLGDKDTAYNRKGYHVNGKEYDDKSKVNKSKD